MNEIDLTALVTQHGPLAVALIVWAEARLLPLASGPRRLLRAIARRVGLSADEIEAAEAGTPAAKGP